MMLGGEFSRLVRLDTLGQAPRAVPIEAEADEREALAKRFGLAAIERLKAKVTLTRDGDAVRAEGRIDAAVVQTCVATGDPLPATIDEPFALRFVPADQAVPAGDEVELEAGDLDTMAYSGGAIELGEAVAETLALALDPFPRAPDADARLREAGVLNEGEAGPFAGLKALRDKLGGADDE